MTRILWDQVATKIYRVGIDRGVLYFSNGTVGVPWNGLTGVEESFQDDKTTPLYFDGLRYYNYSEYGDFAASLSAITYPTEFETFDGMKELVSGFYVDSQLPSTFGLTYRNLVGNDVSGQDLGYEIHILYGLSTNPTERSYDTISNSPNPLQFGWDISGIPSTFTSRTGWAPTAHIIADSRYMNPLLLSDLEDILYGSATTSPRLPTLEEVGTLLEFLIRITDNGDGTWTATGPASLLTDFGDGTFQIDQANTATIDADTYQLTDTPA